jgi:hypothetical protein
MVVFDVDYVLLLLKFFASLCFLPLESFNLLHEPYLFPLLDTSHCLPHGATLNAQGKHKK